MKPLLSSPEFADPPWVKSFISAALSPDAASPLPGYLGGPHGNPGAILYVIQAKACLGFSSFSAAANLWLFPVFPGSFTSRPVVSLPARPPERP